MTGNSFMLTESTAKLTAGKMISQKWELKTENNENLIIAIL